MVYLLSGFNILYWRPNNGKTSDCITLKPQYLFLSKSWFCGQILYMLYQHQCVHKVSVTWTPGPCSYLWVSTPVRCKHRLIHSKCSKWYNKKKTVTLHIWYSGHVVLCVLVSRTEKIYFAMATCSMNQKCLIVTP